MGMANHHGFTISEMQGLCVAVRIFEVSAKLSGQSLVRLLLCLGSFIVQIQPAMFSGGNHVWAAISQIYFSFLSLSPFG